MNVSEAIRSRQSTRAFTTQPVPQALISDLLGAARWSPSGANTQPWQVAVVSGAVQKRISDALVAARRADTEPNPDYNYYPETWQTPYRERRKACGLALYGALQITRADKERQLEAWLNNYRFFGAPVGLLFFIDAQLSQGSWFDYGMFVQNIMLAALEHGLATCPQAALAEYPDIVREILGLPATLKLICGISLGYPDRSHPVNRYRTEREPVAQFTRWFTDTP